MKGRDPFLQNDQEKCLREDISSDIPWLCPGILENNVLPSSNKNTLANREGTVQFPFTASEFIPQHHCQELEPSDQHATHGR